MKPAPIAIDWGRPNPVLEWLLFVEAFTVTVGGL